MLPTLVIGLREGLEAALIVGIIAAFLRQQGRSLRLMWVGVGLAMLLSVAVGVSLALVEKALPQAEQEAMETVIGGIAVVFVTGMILWMKRHARDLRHELQSHAAAALTGGGFGLALMAFLAVLREGFETAVFLLATFSAAQSGGLAALGAVIGLAAAVVVGWGIYQGGVRLDLGRFFRWTGAFLILVAAGLVAAALRTAHEAGWLNAGQMVVADLGWLVAPGTVRSALITGVLGIPADPRLVEAIGWAAYLVPAFVYVYWPRAWMPGRAAALRLRLAGAATLCAAALGLAALWPAPVADVPDRLPLVAGGTPVAGASVRLAAGDAVIARDRGELRLVLGEGRGEIRDGIDTLRHEIDKDAAPAGAPASLSLGDLVQLSGGRLPVGISPSRNPGPFDAAWVETDRVTVWTAGDHLVDAMGDTRLRLTLSGGGLTTPRTMVVDALPGAVPAVQWQVAPEQARAVADGLNAAQQARIEFRFWARLVPALLVLAGLALLPRPARRRSRSRLGRAAPSRS